MSSSNVLFCSLEFDPSSPPLSHTQNKIKTILKIPNNQLLEYNEKKTFCIVISCEGTFTLKR